MDEGDPPRQRRRPRLAVNLTEQEQAELDRASGETSIGLAVWARAILLCAARCRDFPGNPLRIDPDFEPHLDMAVKLLHSQTGNTETRQTLIDGAIRREVARIAAQAPSAPAPARDAKSESVAFVPSSFRCPQARLMELIRRRFEVGVKEAAEATGLTAKQFYQAERGDIMPVEEDRWIQWMLAITKASAEAAPAPPAT